MTISLRFSLLAATCVLLSALPPVQAVRAPVSADVYQAIELLYQYDKALPLDAELVKKEVRSFGSVEWVSFLSTHDKIVPALLTIPKDAPRPMPCVLLLHGYGGRKEQMLDAAALLAARGIAAMMIDADLHGERKQPGREMYSTLISAGRDAMMQTITDNRRALDYLETRPEIDAKRIALLGGSMGAILGTEVAALDKRIKTAILVVGGGDWAILAKDSQIRAAQRLRQEMKAIDYDWLARVLAPADPLNFVDKISPRPLLMLNGRWDRSVPVAATRALYDLSKEPKEIVWFDAGHDLPLEQVLPRVETWLKKYL